MPARTRRTVLIGRRKTSISLENAFWASLKEIASEKHCSASALISKVAGRTHADANLSAAARCYILEYYKTKAGRQRHPANGRSHTSAMIQNCKAGQADATDPRPDISDVKTKL